MQLPSAPLKPLSGIELSKEETTLLAWLRKVSWEAVTSPKGAVSYKAKVPEFYGGARLYRMQAGGASAGSLGALEIFIKKLGLQGIIGKQGLYPISGHGNQPRYLTLTKPDLDNLGVGQEEEDEE